MVSRHFSKLPIYSLIYRVQHNVKRVAQSNEAIAAKKKREQSKLNEFLALTDDVLSRVCSS